MNCLIVHAHPNPDSFNHATRSVAVDTLRQLGHRVDVIDLYAIDYQPCLTEQEHVDYHSLVEQGPDDVVAAHMQLLAEANAIIFIYPTWWSGLPAILKGWLERTMLPGFAFALVSDGPAAKALKVRPRLTNINQIVGITSYGSSRLDVRILGDGGRRTITRAVRALCGTGTKCSWLPIYRLDSSSDDQRQGFLDTVAERLTSLFPPTGTHPDVNRPKRGSA